MSSLLELAYRRLIKNGRIRFEPSKSHRETRHGAAINYRGFGGAGSRGSDGWMTDPLGYKSGMRESRIISFDQLQRDIRMNHIRGCNLRAKQLGIQ